MFTGVSCVREVTKVRIMLPPVLPRNWRVQAALQPSAGTGRASVTDPPERAMGVHRPASGVGSAGAAYESHRRNGGRFGLASRTRVSVTAPQHRNPPAPHARLELGIPLNRLLKRVFVTLRSLRLGFLTALLCACCLGGVLTAGSGNAADRSPVLALTTLNAGVLDALNLVRAQHRLAQLRLDRGLSAAALAHSRQMAAVGYFAHRSADGTAFWKRLSLYYPQRTTSSWSVGENLLWTSGDLDSVRALGIWMTSAEHRATILDPRWRDVGIAAVEAAGAPGMYSGLNVVVVTADFGTH